MRKLLLTAACLWAASLGFAQEVTETLNYTDTLAVTVTMMGTEMTSEVPETTVTVQKLEDGNINFLLNNLTMTLFGDEAAVGNIELDGIPVTEEEGYKTFTFEGTTEIAAGDLDGYSEDDWLGPILGDVPLEMTGKMTDEQLYVTIDISMEVSGVTQNIHVEFGSDFKAVVSTTEYTDTLAVTVTMMGIEITSEVPVTTVTVQKLEDGNINFLLNNLTMTLFGDEAAVGNIEVDDITVTEEDGYETFTFEGTTEIAAGDLDGYSEDDWLGPILGDVPLEMTGKMTDDQLYVNIDITMEVSGVSQTIHVEFGSDFDVTTEPEEEPDEPEVQVVSSNEYTDDLVVTLNGESNDPVETTVTVQTLEDGNINILLSNFSLGSMAIGDIEVDDIEVTEAEGEEYSTFECASTVNVAFLGELPLQLSGKMTEDDLYLVIDIEAGMLGTVNVVFGSDFTAVDEPEEEPDEPEEEVVSTEYTENLVYTLGGVTSNAKQATVTVETLEDGNINIVLNNFVMGDWAIGDIEVDSVTVTEGEDEDYSTLECTSTVNIASLGELPVRLSGRMTDAELYLVIDIELGALGSVNVVFGKETTLGIKIVSASPAASGIYDLSGRRVQSVSKPGIYIVDGKKMMLK